MAGRHSFRHLREICAQPFTQLRPAPSAGDVAYRNGDSLLLTDHHDQSFAARDAGVEKIPLQHGVMLSEHRDDGGRIFRALALGLGRVLAPRFQPCTLSVGGAAPSAARDFLFAQFTGGAGRWPSYGVIADRWPQPRQADGSRTCARSEISAVHFIRWRGGAERRAGFSFCTIHRRRWPLAELRGDRRPLAAAAAS